MLHITNETKIGKFWDYEKEKINKETKEEIIKIVNFRELVSTKVDTKEWTEEEYMHFTSIIKQLRLKVFLEFIEVANTIVQMPQLNCYKELINLLNKKLLETSPDYKSIPHMIAYTISGIESRLFSISLAPIAEEETHINESIGDRISFYEELYKELNNKDSIFTKCFEETFDKWVNDNFTTTELKSILLDQKQHLINIKKNNIKLRIKTLYSKQAIIKESPISRFKKEVKIHEVKRHGLRSLCD